MSAAWSEGYFADVGYTYGYYREISPVFQRFCLLLDGLRTNESTNATHCELGFGQGISINIHAACSLGNYMGTDFNPAHAAHANGLVQASGSGAALYDDSFEQLLKRDDLPQFDSISLHGIWTWVSRENQKIIVEFVRRRLKPGGICYISYNCFPGWSPAYPLRQLFALHDRLAGGAHGAEFRVESAIRFTEQLLAANPLYARAVPGLDARLKKIMEQNKHYLAHEYFNSEWNCMYFTDVVDAVAPAKLDYVGTAVPLDRVDAVNLTAEGQAFLKEIANPILREQSRDYFVNQQFRRDLYVRGAVRLTPAEQRAQLLATRFALLQHADSIPLKVNGAVGEAALQDAIYKPVIAALAEHGYKPKTLAELAGATEGLQYAQLLQAITILVGVGVAAPCQSEAVAKQVQKRCDALNRHICEKAQFRNGITALASAVTGGGVTVGRFEQLFLLALRLGKKSPQEWAALARQILADQGQRLVREGRAIESPEENLAELTAQAQNFGETRLPVLRALQVA